jgi:hypothetical protein
MNSNVNYPDNTRLLSEVPAEELAAIVGGAENLMLWDEKTGVGVKFTTDRGIVYSTVRKEFWGQ